jgi:hypothetical protein
MKERFLFPYPGDELDMIEDLADEVYDNFPYSIAYTLDEYEQYLEQENYFRAFRRYIDFFEISIQYSTSLLLSILKHRQIPFDETLEQVSTRIISKPLAIGDWINDIFIVLLKHAYTIIPDEEIVASLHETLFERKGNILQGWSGKSDEEFKGVGFFRNEYLGHDSSLDDSIFKELLEKIEPRIFRMLEAMRPLGNYSTLTLDKVVDESEGENNYTILPLRGVDSSRPLRVSSDTAIKQDTYYLIQREIKRRDHFKDKELIEISPFVVYLPINIDNEEEKTPFLFQSVHQRNLKRMIYIAPNKLAKRRETEVFKDLFLDFLKNVLRKSVVGEDYKVEIATGKTWEEYIELISEQTSRFLFSMKAEKYDPALYVDRKEIMDAWDAFLGETSKRSFVLLGGAGAGKTNLICRLSEIYLEQQCPVITFNCKLFTNLSLEDKLSKMFRDGKSSAGPNLQRINEFATKQNKLVYVFFDALNECVTYNNDRNSNGPLKLLLDIDNLLVRKELDRFRILISCRTYTWEEAMRSEEQGLNLPLYFTLNDFYKHGQTGNLSLKGFSPDELMQAYPKYAAKYDLKTPVDVLQEPGYTSMRVRLEDPLVLKVASNIYQGNYLPKTAKDLDSISLFSARIDMLGGSGESAREVFILEQFTRFLRKFKWDCIRLNKLYMAYEDPHDPLHELAQKLFADETFGWDKTVKGLFEQGVLRVEKAGLHQELRFVYERFHEYMYARIFIEDETAQLAAGLPVPATRYEQELADMKGYAVINGALRHALSIDYHRTNGDPSVLIQLAISNAYGAPALVMETLSGLIAEKYDEVCRIIKQLLQYRKEELLPSVTELEEKEHLIEEGAKGKKQLSASELDALNARCKDLTEELLPVITVRKVAMHTIYEIFRSPVYSRNLFEGINSPFSLLWDAMSDPMAKVRDNVSLYIYYISRFDREIGIKILDHLSTRIMDTSLWSMTKSSKRQELKQSFMEPAGRLSLLMITEGLVQRSDYELSSNIIKTWGDILRKFTLGHTIIKIVLPFLKFFLRRQAVVQTEYVNNGIEYQNFWQKIPASGPENTWNIEAFGRLVPFLDHAQQGFEKHHDVVFEGIRSGDAFSFFLIERVMITQGWKDWDNIAPVLRRVIGLTAGEQYLDYIQMSMLYVLFHVIEKSDTFNDEAFDMFANLNQQWSARCKGLFMAHNNAKANKGNPYKQYPLNWYGAAYCKHFGDGGTRPGDEQSLPVFRHLISKAFNEKDKELLYYCVENMAVLVTDFSRPESALQLFEYLMGFFKYESDIAAFDSQTCNRAGYNLNLREFLCKMIGTIKSYYPRETEHFIYHKLVNSDFPGIDRFREELINYNQSHENIGDLLTHKFGNFIIWGLLHDKNIMAFFRDGFAIAPEQTDYFGWFDGIVRISFRRLFDMKL